MHCGPLLKHRQLFSSADDRTASLAVQIGVAQGCSFHHRHCFWITAVAASLARKPKPHPLQAGESRRQRSLRPGASQNVDPGLRAEHPLLIGSQDQRLLAGQEMRLCRDVPLAIQEQHPQQPACRIKELH